MTRDELLQVAKPLLFNTKMVQAILEGRKMQTRRIIKKDIVNQFDIENDGKTVAAFIEQRTGDHYSPTKPCRFKNGDILYVRETFSKLTVRRNAGYTSRRYVYRATDQYPFGEKYIVKFKWKPSIHMPKEAARIFLKVKSVRVERLRDIGYFDCIAEGISYRRKEEDVINNFKILWDSTIKKADMKECGWDANPWVWAIEFERIEVE